MVKKTKEARLNLYNFNADDESKNKQSKKKGKKRAIAKGKNIKNKEDKQENNKFDFNNEIVIGLPKIEEKNDTKIVPKKGKKKKAKNKKKQKSRENQEQKSNIQKSKVSQEKIAQSKESQNKIAKNKVSRNKIAQNNVSKNKKQTSKKNKKTKKKVNIKILKYSFLLFSVLAIVIITMFSPLFNIKEIIVTGNEKITKDEIISLSQINIEENTYKINTKKVENRILENPYIKSVEVKRSLPSGIILTVQERKTTFMIEYGNGYVYVNNQGYILEISSGKLEVPILQGVETAVEELVPGNRLCNEDLKKLSTVNKIMEMAYNNEIANLITRIDMENSQNYKIVLESEQKVAYLGDETELNTKILSIKAILEREKDVAGEIFVNGDMKNTNPVFRQNV